MSAAAAEHYDIDIDEEEIQATDRTAYRRVQSLLRSGSASTRTIVVHPTDPNPPGGSEPGVRERRTR
jgi:hypothetical protein